MVKAAAAGGRVPGRRRAAGGGKTRVHPMAGTGRRRRQTRQRRLRASGRWGPPFPKREGVKMGLTGA